MLSPSDLQRLSELEAAATPGPWDWYRDGGKTTNYIMCPAIPGGGSFLVQGDIDGELRGTQENLDVLLAARNSLPALLADIATLKARVAELEAEIEYRNEAAMERDLND